jgi:recombination protein RecT
MVPAQGGAVAPVAKKDIDALIKSDQFKSAVAKALPKHMTADRFVRVALTAMMRTPELRECTQESLFKCLLDLSMYGLEPDGRRAHLIPFKRNWKDSGGNWHSVKDVQLIIDYKGLAELVRRSGDVSYIHADVVCEGDEFDYGYGSGAFLKHRPTLEGARDAKSVYCAYSFVKLKDGSEDFLVISRGEIEAVRARSKAKDSGPWVTDWSAMAAKTAFRRHSKWLPLSPEVRDAIEADDDAIDIKLAETPDGDPAWLETGSVKAAQDVAERRIAELEAQQAKPAAEPENGAAEAQPAQQEAPPPAAEKRSPFERPKFGRKQ